MSNKIMGELIARCFNARTDAHLLHLQTESLSEHLALGDFYEGIVELADGIAEAYQGQYGLIKTYPTSHEHAVDAQDMLGVLRDWINENRDECCEDSYIQNLIDGVVELVQSTLYKLKFLK